MYIISNVMTRDGHKVKSERIGRKVYSVDRYTDTFSGNRYCFAEYADPELAGKALHTSRELWRTEDVTEGIIIVETENSIYTFKEIRE